METLPDYPCREGGVLLVGVNPAPKSVAIGHYYQGPHGQRLWARLKRLGLLKTADDSYEDEAFVAAGNGLTDLVKRPTPEAADITREEMDSGVTSLKDKIRQWKPELLLFAYKPPAAFLLGRKNAKPGRCVDFEGICSFLLTGPYAAAEDAARIDRELTELLNELGRDSQPMDVLTKSSSHLQEQPEKKSSVQSTPAKGVTARTQRVTEVDLEDRRIRLPRAAREFFPGEKSNVRIELRGQLMDARYDPRIGPDRERSATLVFKKSIAHLVRSDEVLKVVVRSDGMVCLS